MSWVGRLTGVAGVSALGLAALALAAATGLVSAAGAARAPATPLPLRTSAVGQAGRLITWDVQAARPFSPRALKRNGRALCLLIRAPDRAVLSGQVCVAGPAKGSQRPRLIYEKSAGASGSRAVRVPATITRPSPSELDASFLPSAVGLRYRPFYWQVISSLSSGCTPARRAGRICAVHYPVRPVRLKLHDPVLVGCQARGPSLVYSGPSSRREIALTFDDGPWNAPPTLDFLHLLEREQVPATFFLIGRQITSDDPGGAVAKRMLADGDMIGDHTWSHPDMAGLKPDVQRAQLLDTIDAIRRATGGFTPCLWRPPYGAITPSLVKLARSLGLLTIGWNVDPRDWALPGTNAIYANVVANARPGAIVVEHVGGGPRYETLDALPKEIQTLRRRGYAFVTVAQLLGLKLVYR